MSWRFPPHRIQDRHVAGTQDVNENLWEFADAINGRLNEHNFAADSLLVGAFPATAPEAPLIIHYDYTEVASNDPRRTSTPTGTIAIARNGTWQEVDARVQFTSRGGLLWIVASGQSSPGLRVGSGGSLIAVTNTIQVAIALNGQIQAESMTGTTDLEQSSEDRPLGTDGAIHSQEERAGTGLGGVWQNLVPWASECLLVVPPGDYTVDVRARRVAGSSAAFGVTAPWIFNRELIVMEFAR